MRKPKIKDERKIKDTAFWIRKKQEVTEVENRTSKNERWKEKFINTTRKYNLN